MAMPRTFRSLVARDQGQLWEWLHVALWDPPPAGLRPREVLDRPDIRIYADGWGRPGDLGVVAVIDGEDAGACWMRHCPGELCLGYVDERTPTLAIALMPRWQHQGHGEPLMRAALDAARAAGVPQVALTVHPLNPARGIYQRCGFADVGLRGIYHHMVCPLSG